MYTRLRNLGGARSVAIVQMQPFVTGAGTITVKRLIVGLSVFVGIVAIVGIILLRDWIGQIARY